MVIPRTSLRGFMRQAKANLQSAIQQKAPVTIVIGNESADLDSITSSIVYAYISSISPQAHSSPSLHIPVLNIAEADIKLRPELLALLPHANVEPSHLITLDDLPSASTSDTELPAGRTKWILVDHNALQGRLGAVYSSRVFGAIDHHDDEGKVPQDTGNEPRVITRSGSCQSLVVNYVRQAWDRLALQSASSGAAHAQSDSLIEDEAIASLWDAQVAQLALASILIDTFNMTDKNKVTDHDKAAVDYLLAKINICPKVAKDFNKDSLFNSINDAKKELDSLTVTDILRKDYKQWTENGIHIGVSSVVKPLSYLQEKAGSGSDSKSYQPLIATLRDFAIERSLAIAVIMTTYTADDGAFARELLTVSFTAEGAATVKTFDKSASPGLQLQDLTGGYEQEHLFRVWRQHNVSASRKQVAPMLRRAAGSSQTV